MKKITAILFTFFVIASGCAGKKESTDTATNKESSAVKMQAVNEETTQNTEEVKAYAAFSFEETEFDFGEINQGDVVEHTFNFTNTGDASLLISDIKTTCGCTTPDYTREPVAPGEAGEILVKFNSSGKSGVQNKRVTIYANTANSTDVISIQASIKTQKEIKGPFKVQ